MRKNREFRPDKAGTGLLNKLYLTSVQRRALLKWGLYALLLVLLSIVQDVMLCRFRVYGATTDLVPCGIFLISILEGSESGCVFTLLASWIYLYTGTAPGPYSIVFITVLGVCGSILRQVYLQKGFGAALLCVGVCLVLYELSVFGIGLFLGMTFPDRIVGFFITAGLSVLAVPVLYPLALWIQTLGGETWKE